MRNYNACNTNRYLSTHHERDAATGYDNRGARLYDAEIGRFLGVDPLAGKFQEWSSFNYVLGSPVRLVDPDGEAPSCCGAGDRSNHGAPAYIPPPNKSPLFDVQNYVANKLNGIFGTKIPLWNDNVRHGSETTTMAVNGLANTTLGVTGMVGAVLLMPETTSLGGAAAVTTLFVASSGEAVVGLSQLTDVVINDADPNSSLHQSESLPGVIAREMDSEYAGVIDAGAQVVPALMTGGLRGATGIPDFLEAYGAIKKGKKAKAALKAFTAKDAAEDLDSFVSEVDDLINKK